LAYQESEMLLLHL